MNLTRLDTAIERHFDAKVQKCVLHLKRNLLRRVRQTNRTAMAEDLAYVFNLSERNDFRDELKKRAKWLYDK
jgi:transposase-like protein